MQLGAKMYEGVKPNGNTTENTNTETTEEKKDDNVSDAEYEEK